MGKTRSGGAVGGVLRILAGLVVALIALVGYLWNTSENEVTGEKQRVALSTEEEIALGLQSMPQMVSEFGGLAPDPRDQDRVDEVGAKLLGALEAELAEEERRNPYPFEFHLLADEETINAFALPGGQVFLTTALYNRLENDDQLAIVLGHEIGHVLARHSAEHLAKQKLTGGLVGATGVATGDADTAQIAGVVGSLVNMRHGRNDEYESDRWGVRLAADAGYDPQAIFQVMEVLTETGGGYVPEFLSTHPKPANRTEYAKEILAEEFPQGIPHD